MRATISAPFRALFTLSISALLPLSAGAADPVLTGQARSLHAESGTVVGLWDESSNPVFPDFDPPTWVTSADETDDAAAAGFGPFSDTAESLDPVYVVHPLGSASASQTSQLAATHLTASGNYSATTDAYFATSGELALANLFLQPPVPFNFGIVSSDEAARSTFSVDFTISEPTGFHLSGDVAVSDTEFFIFTPSTSASASITLEESGDGTVASVSIDQTSCGLFDPPCSLADSIDSLGVLAPGSYTLFAEAIGTAESNCADIDGLVCFEPVSGGSFTLVLELTPASAAPALGPVGLVLLAATLCLAGSLTQDS